MNRNNLFSIGEVSKLFHISVSSLRHYEHVGLLTPAYTAPDSGYRYYGTEQFEVLNTIRYLRTLEMPLPEIEDFLKNRDIGLIEEKLRRQKDAVLQKQRELKRIEKKIDRRLDRLADAQNTPLDTVSLVRIPSCRIAWVETPLNIRGFLDMEQPIRKLDKSEAEAVVFLGKVGLGIFPEHLQAFQTKRYDGIFLILDPEDAYANETTVLPPSLCARIRFRGSHTQADDYYVKLLNHIKRHKMTITGFSREITLIDYGITNDAEKFVTEICIPVSCGQIPPLPTPPSNPPA